MENSLSRVSAPSPRKQSGEMGEGVHAKPSSVSPFPSGVRVQAKLESTEVSLNELLLSVEIVTFLSLGEGERAGAVSSSHSFNELYALSMKMKAKSEQQGISSSLRKRYLLVAAYLYGLASYVASDDNKNAVRKRAERWKTRAEKM